MKVSLLDIEPPIWRRILVPAELPLAKLHRVLNEAMGWTNSHLHSFEANGQRYGNPADDPNEDLDHLDERKIRVGELAARVHRFLYEYDFGDGWTHEVVVEARSSRDERVRYPICVAGARACPPEDSGGPHGYEDFLEAMRSPKHREHDAMLTWIGGYFDPEGFDVNRTNAALRAIRT